MYCTRFVLTHLGDGTTAETDESCWEEVPEECEVSVSTDLKHSIDHEVRETNWKWWSGWEGNAWCRQEDLTFTLSYSASGDDGVWSTLPTTHSDWCEESWCTSGSYENKYAEAE